MVEQNEAEEINNIGKIDKEKAIEQKDKLLAEYN